MQNHLFRGIEPYEPNFFTSGIGAGTTVEFELSGRRGEPYGVTRFLPGGTPAALEGIDCALWIGDERKLMESVRLSTIRRLFLRKGLQVPLEISPNDRLRIELTNTTAGALSAGLQLKGLPGEALQRWKDRQAGQGRIAQQPTFMYASADVGANSTSDIEVRSKSRGVDIHRMAFGRDAEDEVVLSIYVLQSLIKQDVTARQIVDEYQDPERLMPHHLGADTDLLIQAENTTGAQVHVSFLAECYYR